MGSPQQGQKTVTKRQTHHFPSKVPDLPNLARIGGSGFGQLSDGGVMASRAQISQVSDLA
jgi:hypothetical protein